jgi:hypothetical protein
LSRPDPGKLPGQVDFELKAREAHHTGDVKAQRLAQRANLIPRETKGLDFADNLVHDARMLK